MKHNISCIAFFIVVFSIATSQLRAQSLERQVIGSAGAYQTASWGSLSATTSESVTNTFTSASIALTQGFQQPLPSDLFSVVHNVLANGMSVNVFPNPASDAINVIIEAGNQNIHYYVTLLDLTGQALKVPSQDFSSGTEAKFTFYLVSLANGAYLIQISDERNEQVKTIKFSKIN